eukprot:8064644-Pyramimonas_sp.AAC.1
MTPVLQTSIGCPWSSWPEGIAPQMHRRCPLDSHPVLVRSEWVAQTASWSPLPRPLSLLGQRSILDSQAGCGSGRSILDNITEREGDGVCAHLEGQDKAAQLITDFRAACPSLMIQWLLFV